MLFNEWAQKTLKYRKGIEHCTFQKVEPIYDDVIKEQNKNYSH